MFASGNDLLCNCYAIYIISKIAFLALLFLAKPLFYKCQQERNSKMVGLNKQQTKTAIHYILFTSTIHVFISLTLINFELSESAILLVHCGL